MTAPKQLRYKMLMDQMRSMRGNQTHWRLKEWQAVAGEIKICRNGFHCSPTPLQAMRYVTNGVFLAVVETAGQHTKDGRGKYSDKSAWRRMRVVKVYRWTLADAKATLRLVYSLHKAPSLTASISLESHTYYISSYAAELDPNALKKVNAFILKRVKSREVKAKK